MKEEIKNLVDISRKIGSYPQFVQGGGGNTSVKINDNLMAIKASGYLLKNMTEDNAFAFVNYRDIDNHIENDAILSNTDDEFSDFIKEKISKINGYPILKPSIETGFHALLPYKYIIHTHSIYSNILCCSSEGKGIVQKLFSDGIWVKYANPGKDITIEISKATKDKKSNVIFMQNHGIIVCANNANDAQKLHEAVNNKIINHFNISSDYKLEEISLDIDDVKEKVLFPDQAVYILSEDLRKTTAGIETLYAYDYIIKKINDLGLTPNFISKEDINYIENMESEKYRKSLIKK
jgi:rhamnose utilization protein RhaD (predicted bifunctional aldolase and dehydrogenase)